LEDTADSAVASLQLLSALRPLFDELDLPGSMNEYVKLSKLQQGCADINCCCEAGLEVQINLPALPSGKTDIMEEKLEWFVSNKMDGLRSLCMNSIQDCDRSTGSTGSTGIRRSLLRYLQKAVTGMTCACHAVAFINVLCMYLALMGDRHQHQQTVSALHSTVD
jgi:hypothetical protein